MRERPGFRPIKTPAGTVHKVASATAATTRTKVATALSKIAPHSATVNWLNKWRYLNVAKAMAASARA